MRNIYIGDMGVLVEYMQLALKRAGYDIAIDGKFGRNTCSVLKDFLGRYGMHQVGCYVDKGAWDRLADYLKGYTTHIIVRDDTLYGIAQKYDSSVSDILRANPSVDENNLQPGTRIYVPFRFALVSEEVAYTSILTSFIVEGLKVRYPFIETGCIGKSVMGKELNYIRLGSGEKEVFYNAGFHANEWITTPVLLKFAEEYAASYAQSMSEGDSASGSLYGADTKTLFENFSLYIVPLVNPDGVDLVNGVLPEGEFKNRTAKIAANFPFIPYPSGWKANIRGVDLNLQFPAGWENAREIKYEQGYTMPAPRDYVGEGPLTEPESIAVFGFTQSHDFRLILAYHTQGRVIYWKYLDYEPEGAKRIADYFGSVSGYLVEETPYASGFAGYKDWFIEEYNRPGYTIEAGEGINPLGMNQFLQIYENNRYILTGAMTQL